MRPAVLWRLSCRAYQRKWLLAARVLKGINFLVFHALLPYEAQIQPDIELAHYALGVVIHPNVTIGRRVTIFHHVTLAASTWIGSEHKIVIADDVVIGAGAIVIARTGQSLFIGEGACVGAGAVVTQNVAPGQTVVGSPARPIAAHRDSSAALDLRKDAV